MMRHTIQLIEEYNTEYLLEPKGKTPAVVMNQESPLVARYNHIYVLQGMEGFNVTYCVTIIPSGHVVYASNVYKLFSKYDQIFINKFPLKAGCVVARLERLS
jgi:hypothetical protein